MSSYRIVSNRIWLNIVYHIVSLVYRYSPDPLLVPSQKLTEQRVPVFSHEIVPDYLRTKPDPEVEEQEKQLSAEAARIGPEVAQVS